MQFSTVFLDWWYMYHWWYVDVNCISKMTVNVFMWKKKKHKIFMNLNSKNTKYNINVLSTCGTCNCLVRDVGM